MVDDRDPERHDIPPSSAPDCDHVHDTFGSPTEPAVALLQLASRWLST
jgi:hypothetical protein